MIVLDSSFLIAFHNERDLHHDEAVRVMDRLLAGEWGTGLLLEYVALEVITVLRLRTDLGTALSVADSLLRARELQFLPCSAFFMEALETLRLEQRSPLSLVDAAIVTVARRHPPGLVATFDADFMDLDRVTPVP